MLSIANLSNALQSLFTTDADEFATQTGFVGRKRLWTGPAFAQTLVFGWLERPDASLERLASHTGSSKQALAQRFTPQAVDFLGALLGHALELSLAAIPAAIPLLRRFDGVYVEDCTTISLPRSCAASLPGCGGPTPDAGLAALKVYSRYEITGGSITEIDFQPGRFPDVTAGQAHTALPAGSLRLADLGFFDLGVLSAYTAQGVHWINRLPANVTVATGKSGPISLSDFLAGQKGDRVDRPVTVGAGGELSCRLLAWRCPEEVARKRREKLVASARKKGRRVSARQWELAGWTVLVTNLLPERLSALEAWELYRARWQIELLFKRWKSLGGLAKSAGWTRERVLCEVLAKLLGQVVANWAMLMRGGPLAGYAATKAMRVVQELAGLIRRAVGVRPLLEMVLAQIVTELGRLRPTKRKRQTTRERLLDPLHAA
jgi:hypothetical protein